MQTFIMAFIFFLVVVAAMAVGYVFQRKTISGSCGGLGAIGVEKACDCPEPCDRKKARMEREEAKRPRNGTCEKSQSFLLIFFLSF